MKNTSPFYDDLFYDEMYHSDKQIRETYHAIGAWLKQQSPHQLNALNEQAFFKGSAFKGKAHMVLPR